MGQKSLSFGRQVKQRLFLDGWASALAFSPDSRLLAIGTDMNTVKILDCATGRVRAVLDPVEDGYSEALWAYVNEVGYGLISQVYFSPDGRYLAVVNEDHGTLRLWETGSWQTVTTWVLNLLYDDEEEESPFGEFAVSQIAFTPDSRRLVIIPYASTPLGTGLGRANTAALFTVPEGKRVQRLAFPERVVSVGMTSPSDPAAGTIFAFGDHNHFWEAAYGEWSKSGRSWFTLYASPSRANEEFTRQTIRQVVVTSTGSAQALSENCILALIEKQGHNPRSEGHTSTLAVNDLPCGRWPTWFRIKRPFSLIWARRHCLCHGAPGRQRRGSGFCRQRTAADWCSLVAARIPPTKSYRPARRHSPGPAAGDREPG